MLNCSEAIGWIVLPSMDGRLDLTGRERLSAHLKVCSACRQATETQVVVKRVLAARPDEALPLGFSTRLLARLYAVSSSAWLEAADWRTWSIRLLPVAAALFLFAGIVDRSERAEWAEKEAATILASAPPGVDANLLAVSDTAEDRLDRRSHHGPIRFLFGERACDDRTDAPQMVRRLYGSGLLRGDWHRTSAAAGPSNRLQPHPRCAPAFPGLPPPGMMANVLAKQLDCRTPNARRSRRSQRAPPEARLAWRANSNANGIGPR